MQADREFQVFIKPVGALCNLSCSYCYYLDKSSLYPAVKKSLMSDEVLEKYVIQHISAATDELIFFSWHGGEPLLAGIDFYKRALAIQKKHLPPGRKILNGIQTNGTLINEEWSRFFSDEKFIAGVSIDGPQELHNVNRTDVNKNHTFEKVIRGIHLLQDKGINPELLCVVSSSNVNHALEVYGFFRDLGAEYITFLPLVERSKDSPQTVTMSSVNALAYGRFLSLIFDRWIDNDIGRIKIQIVEEAARTAFDQDHTLCIFKEKCGGVPVIEHNGDFYTCDHYVNMEHRLGNICDHSLEYFLDSKEQRMFGEAKSATLPAYCRRCEVLNMCNGECPKNRFIESPDGEAGLNYLCEGYRHFFNHIRPFIEAIKFEWGKQ